MDFLLGRYRNLTILVGVLFLQMLGLAVQVRRMADHQDTRLIRIWAVDTITPIERAIVWAQNGTHYLWTDYFFLRGVRAENRELKHEIEQMRLQQVRLSEDAEQAHRLQRLLSFQEQVIAKTVPAQVIGSSASDLSRTVYIDKGSKDNIAPDMAVISASGIVGKVLRVFPSTSLILMINDQSSGVGAMLDQSRLQGVVRGTADGQVVLERVMSDEKVSPGETVLSSGGDQIFPKGMPLGTVTDVKPGHDMFLSIHIKPAADLSRLEEVLVVTEKQQQSAPVENSGRVRAADILAQRLPSVPDKSVMPPVTPEAAGVATISAPKTNEHSAGIASKVPSSNPPASSSAVDDAKPQAPKTTPVPPSIAKATAPQPSAPAATPPATGHPTTGHPTTGNPTTVHPTDDNH